MAEHFKGSPYERDEDLPGIKAETTPNTTSRLTHMRRGRGAVAAALGNNPFMPKPERAKPAVVEFTPEEIARNAERMQQRDDQLRTEADERMAAAQQSETQSPINIVGGNSGGVKIEFGELSAADQARIDEAARVGERIAEEAAQADSGTENDDTENGGDSVTVTRDGKVIVRGNPQIGTIVGGQVHHYPRH